MMEVSQAQVISLTLGPVETNCFIVADLSQRMAVVIDPAWDGTHIAEVLSRQEWSLCSVLVTHAHFDHIAGAPDLLQLHPAPLYLDPGDLPLWSVKGGAELFGVPIPTLEIEPQPLRAGQVLRCGALSFEVLSLPGHTPGHVAFLERGKGWLFSGDVIFAGSIGRTDLPGGDFDELIESIRARVLSLPDETVIYSGHGPETTVGRERRSNPFLA